MIVRDNTIQAEGLQCIVENLGKNSAYSGKKATNVKKIQKERLKFVQ